ncbi:hypothetical protein QWY14_02075 [Planococcus sp. N028]|uniref:YneQ n=1 Tax=Planococcus shixiaomingii TaxID=3058393 RepID=A0ABT8MY37_9BACL|nr:MULTISPECIES: hypothetical protein [unclassified Planococcus (in: firmicutes)]MDN7240554.1 hypothetical protein [Planococcus sp. N028]WKA56446.1 hypothetical protein QWY21_08895 [Planococcus sp. N022]
MAFGVKREELQRWKQDVEAGKIAFLTHYWVDERFPGCDTVTKVGCCDLEKLGEWGRQYGLRPEWMDLRGNYPHFDLFGDRQSQILTAEGINDQLKKFNIRKA